MISPSKITAFFLLLCASAFAQITPTLGKTPAYFYDRYGKQISERTVPWTNFTDPVTQKSARLSGPFLIKDYNSDNMGITVVFTSPGLEAIQVRYTLTHEWTTEQCEAVLSVYGKKWSLEPQTTMILGFKTWTSETQISARVFSAYFEVNAAAIAPLIAQKIAEAEAARKAVPKF